MEPFLVGCHCAATSGWTEVNELVTETFLPEQQGQPLPKRVRLSIALSHSWSSPSEHFHQYFLCDLATTWSGVREPFFVGCHWTARFG